MPRKEGLEYNKVIGAKIKKMIAERGWDADKLARHLSIQCYRNLPDSDRGENFKAIFGDNSNDPLDDRDNTIIKNYLENKYKKSSRKIVVKEKQEETFTLNYAISEESIKNYLSGITAIPMLEFISLCQLLNISLDTFITDVYKELKYNYSPVISTETTTEQAYNIFTKNIFGDKKDNRYVFDTEKQQQFFSSLLFGNKTKIILHFTYLPIKLDLINQETGEKVIFQRGKLTFEMRNGMCHVTSNLEVSSQGTRTEYKGFAVIMNPHSTGPTCTCFLKEVNNSFGIFILFTFRLSRLGSTIRKIRISECMSVRRDDGTSFIYRLLISENNIDDENMKYFCHLLKLMTSENTNDDRLLNIIITEKTIKILKKYFNGTLSTKNENSLYIELQNYFGGIDNEYIDIIEKLEHANNKKEAVYIIDPAIFNKKNKKHLLLWAWLGKFGLSARHDKIDSMLDDEVERIYKTIYPMFHNNDETLDY